MNKEQRQKMVIARGEFSNHSHVLFGDIEFLKNCFKVESKEYNKALSVYDKYKENIKNKTQEEKEVIQDSYNKEIELLNVSTIRHILETDWVNNSNSVWTKEHIHIPIKTGTYHYIAQTEYNPLNDEIQRVAD